MKKASPKAISRRTSYFQFRLVFRPYPQLIRSCCTASRFGPPLAFRQDSPWPWIAQLVSGLIYVTERFLKLGFPAASSDNDLALQHILTRWLVLQKARHHHTTHGNSKLQIPNYKQSTNPKFQISNSTCFEFVIWNLSRICCL